MVRFIFNLRTKQKNSNDYRSGDLSAEEIVVSKEHWLKYEQLFIANSDKYEKVKNSLKSYYDEKGILRLNTRVSNVENFNFYKKFPTLLRNDSHFTQLVIRKVHEEHYRCGINSTLAFIRYNYWIVRGRQTVKIFLKNCVLCKMVQGKMAISPETSKLPEFRVSCNHPFENVGVDYAGPLYFKENADNCVRMSKCYVLLFTCAATRAVYLELTPDAGVHCLILAVRRFISRNGTLKLFISDNFKSFKSKDIKSYLRKVNINWKFILEKSPWWGGFYERLIGVMKNLLKKAMGRARLTYDEILTILIEIESIINSRPLTYMSDNHDDRFSHLTT